MYFQTDANLNDFHSTDHLLYKHSNAVVAATALGNGQDDSLVAERSSQSTDSVHATRFEGAGWNSQCEFAIIRFSVQPLEKDWILRRRSPGSRGQLLYRYMLVTLNETGGIQSLGDGIILILGVYHMCVVQ